MQIYLEARIKKLKIKSEVGKTTIILGKTLLKGIASGFGIDLHADENDLQDLYQSIDLTNKLIIIEDVERTSIDILELLGYVNSLTEQDNVKVLLVTNEKEIIKNRSKKNKESEEKTTSYQLLENLRVNDSGEKNDYTETTWLYLEAKEKSIGDTIRFTGKLVVAIKEIIQSFNNEIIQRFANDKEASNIAEIMCLMRSENLRSIIFACQKTVDIYEYISNDSYSDDFLRTILYGIVAFSLRIHSGGDCKWIGLEQYSQELGIHSYPLFRFCYDYILTQRFDTKHISAAFESLEKLRLYDSNKTSNDPELQKLFHFYLFTEEEVIKNIERIKLRLNNPKDISFYDYGKIALALVDIEHILEIELDDAKNLLVNNLHGRGDNLSVDDLFWYIRDERPMEKQEEFIMLREAMINALTEKTKLIPDFDYLPEQVESFYRYVINNIADFHDAYGFAKYLDISKLVKMFSNCTSAQMDTVRGTFNAVYRPVNIIEFLADDLSAIKELLNGIKDAKESATADKVQLLQYKWFINTLSEIENKLSAK